MKSCPKCSATYPDEYIVCPKDGAQLSEDILWKPQSIIRGKYKILAKIGEGGMAAVYRAHHQLLVEPRALKVIKPELACDEMFVARFKQEAILTRKLQHTNAVRVDDLDIAEDGRPFMVMELVEGENLKALIQRAGPLPAARVADISLQICEALAAAHALDMIHRDIKPDNIVLVPRLGVVPLVKILDFGIARLKEGAPGALRTSMTLTGTGVVIGTPEYMSPEQAMGKPGEELDGRSDLYSLGIVMYRMLTGELPFKADTTVEMLLHHIQTVPKPPKALRPELGIPDTISAIVMKALEKDRGQRFPTASAMAAAIREAQAKTAFLPVPGKLPGGSRPFATPSAPPASKPGELIRQPSARPPSSKVASVRLTPAVSAEKKEFPVGWAVAGVAMVLVILVGFAVLGRLRTPSPQQATTPSPQPAPPIPTRAPVDVGTHGAPTVGSPSKHTAPVKPNRQTESPSRTAPPPSYTAGKAETSPGQPSPATESSVGQASAESTPTGMPAQEPGQGEEALPNQPRVTQVIQRAQAFFDSGEYARAAQLSRRILAMHPQNRPALHLLSLSLLKQGQQFYRAGEYKRAAAMFRQVLEIAPNNRFAQQRLEECLQAMREQR